MPKNKTSFLDSLLIVIVVYNRNLEACESFQSLRTIKTDGYHINLMVYDNSPTFQNISSFEGIRINYVHNPKNPGISAAYNEAGSYAKKNGLQWLLFLDQDTELPNTLLKTYAAKVLAYPRIQLFAPILKLNSGEIFSPCTYRYKRGFYLDEIEEGRHSLKKIAPVNSGMLVKVNAFNAAGGYNEKVKLDFSDFQFIERFKKIDPWFYVVNEYCLQDFSDDEVSLMSQKTRFIFYCDGAKNCEKDGFWDWIQYSGIALLRAVKLTLKYKNLQFLKIYITKYLV